VKAIAAIGLICGAAWLLGIAQINHFDGLYGQDPYAYYDYGQQVANLIAHGHALGYLYWPLGYPALLGVSFLIGGVNELSAQAVTILCSAAAAVLTGLLTVESARQLNLPERVARIGGVLAWALLLCSGQAIQSGIVVMADMPALMWATLSAWALGRYTRVQKPGWIGLAAFALAWATMTRWQYVALLLPWALTCFLGWRRTPRPKWLQHLTLAIVIGLLTSTPQIVYTLQNPDPALRHEWLTGWSPANAFSRDFVTADGTFHYDQPVAEYYLLPLTSPYYLSVWLLPLVGIGLLTLIGVRNKSKIPAPIGQYEGNQSRTLVISRPAGEKFQGGSILLLGWIAVEYGFLTGIPYQNIRFALAFFPPLIVLAGIGAAQVIHLATRQPITLRIALSLTIIIVSLWGVVSSLAVASDLVGGFVANKNRDLAAVRWAEAQIPEVSASVYTLDLALTITHYSKLRPVQIYYETPASMAARLPTDRPAYALINVWTTEHQWPGKAPWVVYHWLLDHSGMDEIGSYSIYTLYRVH
jgi:4-amino-4-deoxy-L-arabinose transferase-like glycosyltransferase